MVQSSSGPNVHKKRVVRFTLGELACDCHRLYVAEQPVGISLFFKSYTGTGGG